MDAIKQAFVLGAGLGKRLRPLTDDLPKRLDPIFHKPLITFAPDHLIDIGIQNFFINTHRLPETFAKALQENSYSGTPVPIVNEPALLSPAGERHNPETHMVRVAFITFS